MRFNIMYFAKQSLLQMQRLRGAISSAIATVAFGLKWIYLIRHGDGVLRWRNNIGPTLGVRTLDSLHVACALELGARSFWTFDERQERLAIAAGLNTNP
ncbi:hypothetical protein [Terracidiphilus sp.]|jgi:predicted nucleic acid-binding protein|uniref:hypothetical protein n=1 Tax=Terracidiphilus sp. TaxID=1964191 RepID=UPI003C17B3E1